MLVGHGRGLPAGRELVLPEELAGLGIEGAKEPSSVAATKTSPPPVVVGPPRLGEPQSTASGTSAGSATKPSGTSQASVPSWRSTAARVPHGGGL